MKKILTFLNILVLGVLMVASCNLNNHPKFDEKDAFVAFDKAAITVKENAGTVQIPVTLASISGIATTIAYEAIDGTAKLGTNYDLVDNAGTLTFSADSRTQYIPVAIKNIASTYTGDLKFSLKFKTTGDVNAGVENTCTITISDLDHPLSFILGDYNAVSGSKSWTITLMKDASDVSVVWFVGITPYFQPGGGWDYPNVDTRFYGTVNKEKTKIFIPIGQTCAYKYQNTNDIYLYGLEWADKAAGNLNIIKDGKIEMDISADGKTITCDPDMGMYTVDDTGGWDVIAPGIVWSK